VAHVKAGALRELTMEEVQARVAELREELFNLRFRNSMKQLDNPLKIRESRREMARLLTVLNEKRGGAGRSPARGEKEKRDA
jgi:large subunit ribosomal protein L29